MSLEVRYIDIPEGAQKAAQAQSAFGQPFSQAEKLISGGEDTAWATLEPGSWLLDGSRRLLNDLPQDIGWWSNAPSGEDGRFAEPPTIDIFFPEPYTATGITFTFWPHMGHWCSEIRVSWYNGQTLLAQNTAYPDSARWVLGKTVESFDQVRIELLATNIPGHLAKLQQIQIGQVIIFGKEELVRVGLLNQADPSLCELSIDTMKVEVRDRKNRGLAPQKNQKMELYRDGKQIASQYIKEASREARNYYTFSCQSVIGLLEDDYLGGLYSALPLGTVLDEVLAGYAFELDAVFSNETVTGYLPVVTRRQALQQIAFAIGAVITTGEDGTICFSPPAEKITGVFSGAQIFSGAKVSTAPRTAQVQIYAHSYVPSDEEETLLEREAVEGENVLFLFSQPHHSYVISGGSLDSCGVNWVRITANGQVSLSAKKYSHNVSVHTKCNPLATASEMGNTVTVEEATLVHPENVGKTLDRLYSAKQMGNTLTQDAVISAQKVGQKVSSVNPWGSNTEGFITSMDSTLTQSGHTANVTIRGVEVMLSGIHYYAGQFEAGDKEVPY